MIGSLLSGYQSVIALNCKKIIDVELRTGVPVIAADGAARWIEADYIVGDGDSTESSRLIRIPDQDTTDFEKCIAFAKERELLPSLVIGMSGGEFDHILGNVQALLKHSERQNLFFLDPYPEGLKVGIPLEKGEFQTEVEPGATVSLIPFGSCTLSSEGLEWEIHNQTFRLDGPMAIRNRAKGKRIRVDVSKGKALLIVEI
ncbi:MAG: thiamine diphosphokinase [Chlamydiales bacterium]|nr:thiamine diphosphokinase [Chlamydiales bacterium]